jgi:hypothetical protein
MADDPMDLAEPGIGYDFSADLRLPSDATRFASFHHGRQRRAEGGRHGVGGNSSPLA